MMSKSLSLVAASLLLWSFAGCGPAAVGNSKAEPTAAAGGIVKDKKGQPMKDVQVTFFPQGGKGSPARGKTTENGRFVLSTYGQNDGAVPGTHVATAELMPAGALPGKEAEAAGGKKINKKFTQQSSSPFSFTVKTGEANDFVLEVDE